MVYKIYITNADNTPISIWDPSSDSKQIISAKLSLTVNEAGSLELALPSSNAYYNSIVPLGTTIDITEDDKIIWTGRCRSWTAGLNNDKTFKCEGALSFLEDVVLSYKEYKKTYAGRFLRNIIKRYNSDVLGYALLRNEVVRPEIGREFSVGTVTVDQQNVTELWRKTDFETAWECINDMLLNAEGGYLRVSKADVGNNSTVEIDYIDELDDTGNAPIPLDQEVTLGENLVDISRGRDARNIYTAVMPVCHYNSIAYTLVGYEADNSDYASALSDGSANNIYPDSTGKVINKTLAARYGVITKLIEYDMVENLQSVTSLEEKEEDGTITAEEKAELASKRASNNEIILKTKKYMWKNAKRKARELTYAVFSCDVKVADLKHLPGNTSVSQAFRLGKLIYVNSSVHGLNHQLMPIWSVEIDLQSGVKSMTVGIPEKRTLTKIVKTKDSTKSKTGNSGSTKHTTTRDKTKPEAVEVPVIKFRDVHGKYSIGDSVNLSDFTVWQVDSEGKWVRNKTSDCTFTINGSAASGYTFENAISKIMVATCTIDGQQVQAQTTLEANDSYVNQLNFVDYPENLYVVGDTFRLSSFATSKGYDDGRWVRLSNSDPYLRYNIADGTRIVSTTPMYLIATYSGTDTGGIEVNAKRIIRAGGSGSGSGLGPGEADADGYKLIFTRVYDGAWRIGSTFNLNEYQVTLLSPEGGRVVVTDQCTYNIGVDAVIEGGVVVTPADYTASGANRHVINGYEPSTLKATYIRNDHELWNECPLNIATAIETMKDLTSYANATAYTVEYSSATDINTISGADPGGRRIFRYLEVPVNCTITFSVDAKYEIFPNLTYSETPWGIFIATSGTGDSYLSRKRSGVQTYYKHLEITYSNTQYDRLAIGLEFSGMYPQNMKLLVKNITVTIL